ISHQLERVANRECRRLIITVPPRCLKSIATSVAFPAWLLGRDPSLRVLAVSYAESLSEKMALDCQKVLQAPWYRGCFPATRLAKGRSARADFETTRGGGRFSTSIGGTVTGRGGDIIIVDDPHKPEEATSEAKRKQVTDWWSTTLLSRLNDPEKDPIIVIQQRVHEADLAGTLLEQGVWDHLNLPAISEEREVIDLGWRGTVTRDEGDYLHPERLSPAVLNRKKEELGSYVFAAQYQQRPAPVEGGLVKWNWFEHFDRPPGRLPGDQIVQSWDTAIRADEINDYSVCTTWLIRGQQVWLLDVCRVKLEFPELQRRVVEEAQKWKAGRVLIEQAGSGLQLLQQFSRSRYPNVVGIRPVHDKITRLMIVTPLIEGGKVAIPKEAAWMAEFRRELMHFPNGKHDDQVDSVSQLLGWWQMYPGGSLRGSYG
ncbi:MAG: phage terminase large subunit, partial [Silicimonas sp.]|nr:phage terminase large subunit [Silicimonas sp.]